ncbi:MarR family transcriptional regulator [Roseococcus sp. SYP-B2431]|uniref:MarR family winged helix-turn-helix transcriptional regulator n=1 Tax=Roseococcus sp. SYP-B2431 TaxID=2496640 RepID=UPI00103E0A76|nr:MarR family transcriptional regulator [Roseococcus sp. SYP-B2431]TCI00440.1 MarR family transcriptional regulator [Roseococcus sp. SYP-B2431]
MPPTDRIRVTASLLQAGRQWRRLAQDALAAHDISDAQASPLIHLGRLGGGVRQVTLAAHVGIEGPSLVRLLDQLEAAGLLERRDDPDDRRAKTLWLTPEGRRLVQRIERVLRQLREKVLREVSDAEIAAALRVFQAIETAARNA